MTPQWPCDPLLRLALQSKTLAPILPSFLLAFIWGQNMVVWQLSQSYPVSSSFSLTGIFSNKFITRLILSWHQLIRGPGLTQGK